MKTRNENKTVLVRVIDLCSGDCFTTKRTNSQENGIYVKVEQLLDILFQSMRLIFLS